MLYKLLRQLKKSAAGAQLDLSVISLMRCGEIGAAIEQLGVPVHALECMEGGIPRPHRLIRLASQLRKLKPDVVQTWAYHADLVGGAAARISTRANVVWNIRHGTLDPAVDSKNTRRSARLCGMLSRWLPTSILLNAHSAVEVHQKAGYDGQRMRVVPNGFDTSVFRPMSEARQAVREEIDVPQDAPLIGMCGRFHPHKGQAEFVQMARRVAKNHADARFLIAGRHCDDSNSELASWVAEAGIADRIRLLGSRNDIPHLMNAMDVYVLPSLTEGMPNVVGEAMACAVPTVSTDVGDASWLLGDCGSTVPPGDPDSLATATCQVLALPTQDRVAIGQKARRRIVEDFGIDVIAEQYLSIWRAAAEGRHEPSAETGKATNTEPKSTDQNTFQTPSFQTNFVEQSTTTRAPIGTNHATTEQSGGPIKLVHVTTIPMTQWLFLRGQNQFMVDQGFEVHAVSSPGPFMQKLVDRDPVIPHAIPISRKITPARDVISVMRLTSLFRSLRPQIVQLSTPKAALLGAVAAKAAGVPIRIYQVRGLASESEWGVKQKIYQQLERFTGRLCNGCLVNAPSLLDYARQAKVFSTGYIAGQGTSNGVDLARFNPELVRPADLSHWNQTSSDRVLNDRALNDQVGPVIGYIGRMTRDKGLEDLHEAWQTLREDFPEARLLLVGIWENENGVSRQCRDSLRADPRVLITGSQDDVAPFYRHMDIFAFPSHGTEGFPNAPMEAAAMGLPVIVTRVVGCVDAVVNGLTGLVIAPRSPEQLERGLREYMLRAELRKQHGDAGRERIRQGFAPMDIWNELRDYYAFLLRREALPLPRRDGLLHDPRKAA